MASGSGMDAVAGISPSCSTTLRLEGTRAVGRGGLSGTGRELAPQVLEESTVALCSHPTLPLVDRYQTIWTHDEMCEFALVAAMSHNQLLALSGEKAAARAVATVGSAENADEWIQGCYRVKRLPMRGVVSRQVT